MIGEESERLFFFFLVEIDVIRVTKQWKKTTLGAEKNDVIGIWHYKMTLYVVIFYKDK